MLRKILLIPLEKLIHPLITSLYTFFWQLYRYSNLYLGVHKMKIRENDIFIVTYPKSGTTLMQMLFYQLMTDGDIEKITHIDEKIPFIDHAFLLNYKSKLIEYENLNSPRIFKSHLSFSLIPKGPAKYIYILRNGEDSINSFFHQFGTYNGHIPCQGNFNQFVKLNTTSWFSHIYNWWRYRKQLDILFLRYEDLLHDFDSSLNKIINFCNIKIDPAKIPIIKEKCSFAYMKKYENKFEALEGIHVALGQKRGHFIRQGLIGEGTKRIAPEQQLVINKIRNQLTQKLGEEFGNYIKKI